MKIAPQSRKRNAVNPDIWLTSTGPAIWNSVKWVA
jgi:hypothetical protein